MASSPLASRCIWHPQWQDSGKESAGAFVHFRKKIFIETLPSEAVLVHISADTRYKLYINSKLVAAGPVRGDERLWFYDEVDLMPHLVIGENIIAVRVLRMYPNTAFATSFARLSDPGFFVAAAKPHLEPAPWQHIHEGWETSLDTSTVLRVDLEEDQFLHTYENVDNTEESALNWVSAVPVEFPSSHGLSPPWNMRPRMIPRLRYSPAEFIAIHNLISTVTQEKLEQVLLGPNSAQQGTGLRLPAGSSHHIELEASRHLTATLTFYFERPSQGGSVIRVTYSECYEDDPIQVPWLRSKTNRRDTTKRLTGPVDRFVFGGEALRAKQSELCYGINTDDGENFNPFHFRTFRFIALDIDVAPSADLVLRGIDLTATNYPLDVQASFQLGAGEPSGESGSYLQLWETSINTLSNCMHDAYEDCPFYEQLQYAMDTRSSILFTYCIAGDDRLARQAIHQLHNSYRPEIGLTASRAPANQLQLIPHFSLFWVCMVADHLEHFDDRAFVRQFVSVCDGVLEHFNRRTDSVTGLVRTADSTSLWDFVDWAKEWQPLGIPPGAARTGFCSFTSMFYAYTLQQAAKMLDRVGRPAIAAEYATRADALVKSVRAHCFDGMFFTDGLASVADPERDYSEHSQVWAILCGAASGAKAAEMLHVTLAGRGSDMDTHRTESTGRHFTPVSVAMSFYVFRAVSSVGGNLYNDLFHSLWAPWREQLELGLVTWQEDTVSQRSDCHAWACAPLYEFTREVIGVKPAEPGWQTIAIQPRLGLFPEMKARVPFGGHHGATTHFSAGLAHVEWHRTDDGSVRLSIAFTFVNEDSKSPRRVPKCLIIYPDGQREELDACTDIVRMVQLNGANLYVD